jgi:integrase
MRASNQAITRNEEVLNDNSAKREAPFQNRKSAHKMHRPTKGAPKTATAYWLKKVKKPAGSALFGIQIAYRSHRHRFPLETANAEAAAEKARNIYLSLVANGWESTLAQFKPRAAPKPARAATIGEWIHAVRVSADYRQSTFTNYANSIRQIAADMAGIGNQPALEENGQPKRDRNRRVILLSRFNVQSGGHAAWAAKVDALPLTMLTPAAIQAWKLEYINRAGTAPDARQRASNTAASRLRSARSMFSKKARRFASPDLILPDPLPFSSIELPKKANTAYQSKIDATSLIEKARHELTGEPFKIFTFGLLLGLSKKEIDLLAWSQIDFQKGVIHIERTEHFQAKTEDRNADVDMDAEIIMLLRDWQKTSSGPFVVESRHQPKPDAKRIYYRCEAHFTALYMWLRSQGITAQKPLHELRKELGAILASTHGIFAAQSVLRHAQISTTAAYYTDKKRRITAGLGALLAPAPSNVIEAGFTDGEQKSQMNTGRASA